MPGSGLSRAGMAWRVRPQEARRAGRRAARAYEYRYR